MSKARPDFITIQLTQAGLQMAGEAGVVGWANGRRHFEFRAGEPQEVELSYDWLHLLRHEMFAGEPILEPVKDGAIPVTEINDSPKDGE
jgi:hypothetical protein